MDSLGSLRWWWHSLLEAKLLREYSHRTDCTLEEFLEKQVDALEKEQALIWKTEQEQARVTTNDSVCQRENEN